MFSKVFYISIFMITSIFILGPLIDNDWLGSYDETQKLKDIEINSYKFSVSYRWE